MSNSPNINYAVVSFLQANNGNLDVWATGSLVVQTHGAGPGNYITIPAISGQGFLTGHAAGFGQPSTFTGSGAGLGGTITLHFFNQEAPDGTIYLGGIAQIQRTSEPAASVYVLQGTGRLM